MNIYSDKLVHIQVVITCRYSVAQMCTREGTHAHNLGAQYIDDVISYKSLTTICCNVIVKLNWQYGNWIKVKFLLPENYMDNCNLINFRSENWNTDFCVQYSDFKGIWIYQFSIIRRHSISAQISKCYLNSGPWID